MTVTRLGGLVSAALLLVGCYDPGQGVEPPLRQMYFPVGLATSPGATRLFVVNSDFDLQFNGGSLQSLDLERIRSLVPKRCTSDADCAEGKRCDLDDSRWCVDASGPFAGEPCGAFGEKTASQRLLAPGRCGYVHTTKPQDGGTSLVVDAVGISAFATDVVYRARPGDAPGGRLFVPTRGDATLHYIETIDDSPGSDPVGFELECGQRGNDGDCSDVFRKGDDPDEENTRGLRMPAEPFGIAATPNAEGIVITHQTEGAASLFVNNEADWGDGVTNFGAGPRLEFVLGGLPTRAIGVAAIPEPAVVDAAALDYQPGFLVTFRDAPVIHLLRFFDDEASQPERPFLANAGAAPLDATSINIDSRGIAIAQGQRRACEESCAADAVDCLTQCAGIPLSVFVAHRTPASLLVAETRVNASATASDDLPKFHLSVGMPLGPSRVVIGEVIDQQGQRAERVFLISFDQRKIAIVDPEFPDYPDFVETGRGPHSLLVDVGPDYAYGYVAHFTDSYIGVIDLDQRSPTYAQIVLTVGRPIAPRSSK